jgi:hypothetical protein
MKWLSIMYQLWARSRSALPVPRLVGALSTLPCVAVVVGHV